MEELELLKKVELLEDKVSKATTSDLKKQVRVAEFCPLSVFNSLMFVKLLTFIKKMQNKTCTFAELFPDLVDSSGQPLITMEDLETAKTLAQQFELASRKRKNPSDS